MFKKAIQFRSIGFILIFLISAFFVDGQSRYPQTISALQIAYNNEIQVSRNYQAYAQKANSEKYPNMAYLFASFATSELIHAHNFKKLLSDLGAEVKEIPILEIKVSSTRVNLKRAIDFELQDIDQNYPLLVEKCKPENHEAAIRNLTYAWKTEKQHRDLLLKMQSGTGIFFGILAKRIEETSVQFFVCHLCGSTAVELPEQTCPICNNPASHYKVVERIK